MRFSILTACYNASKFLEQYFNSVLSQGSDVEIVFVDDCSTDNSWKIAQKYKSDNVKLIRNKRRLFCSGAYAVALSNASSDCCGIVDADDVLETDAVKIILDLYNNYPKIGYIYTQHWWCDENLKKKRKGISSLVRNQKSFSSLYGSGIHGFSHWRTFKKNGLRVKQLFPDGLKYAVDKYLGFALQNCLFGGFYNHPLYYYRYHKNNMSRNFASEQKRQWKTMSKMFLGRQSFPVTEIYG